MFQIKEAKIEGSKLTKTLLKVKMETKQKISKKKSTE